jgi:hypothetical protein
VSCQPIEDGYEDEQIEKEDNGECSFADGLTVQTYKIPTNSFTEIPNLFQHARHSWTEESA